MGDRVQVAVRVRPLNRREIDLGSQVIVDMDDNQTTLRHPKWAAKLAKNSKESIKKYEPKTFAFDFCFWSIDEQDTAKFAGQEKVFEHVGGAILSGAFEGYNACILAYGQTGSGKSYSMMGSHEQKGIIPRFCESLFQRVGQNVSGHVSFRILVSYMEIYNEKVRDLLEPGSKHNLTVREHSVLGPYVDGLLQLAVESYKEVECLLAEGTKSRTVAATNMNSESSRSHAVLTITLVRTQTDMKTGTVSERVSRINLVDLAGSERASKTGSIGERLREGGNINRSLTTLGLVVKALAERSGKHQSKFVPYRDSVLTWLLKDSLGGNSKTVMLALVSPAADNYEESLSTLRYADSAKHIVNNAVVNEDPNSRIIRELRHEIDELRQRLAQTETLKAPHLKEQLNLSERLMMDICKPWEERLQETERIQRERQGTLEAMGIHVESSGIKVDTGRCFLVNLNADPSLNELLVYYLKAHTRVGRVAGGGHVGGGSAEDPPDIQLEGIGIMPDHCTLDIEQSKVYVTPGADGARTCINGTAIFCRTRARHGDRILWGNNHFFRLNCPKDEDEPPCNLPNETRNRRSAEYELAQEELMQQEMAEDPIHFAIEGMERQLSSRLTSSSGLPPADESEESIVGNSAAANLSSSDRSQWPVLTSGLANVSWTGLIDDDSTVGNEISGIGIPRMAVSRGKKKKNRCANDVHRLANLRKELYRAHSFAREANMLASLVPWCDVVYEVSLQIPACDLSPDLQRLRNGLESRPAIMARRRAHAEQKQLFTMNEFESRLVAMRELCLGTGRDDESVVPQPSDESDDNPFTVSNAWHDLIGVANVFLDALFHEVALDHWVVIVSQYGEVAGRLHVVLTKAGDGLTRRSDDDDHYEDGRSDSDQPSSMTSSTKKITVRVSIKEAKDLPSDLANFVFCQYRFWNSSKLVSVPPAMVEPDDDDVTESVLRSDHTSVKFDHIQDFVVDVTDDFVDYVSGGNALSIEVYGHRHDVAAMQSASGTPSPWTTHLHAEPTSTLAARWAEVTCRVNLSVQVLELGEAGQYEPVELRQLDDVPCGGVFQLRQCFSRRLRVDITCPPDGGRLPVTSVSIESVCIGGICLRSQNQRGLDSYHEQGLELLRQRWHAALDRRRTYLSSKTARAQTGIGTDDAGSINDTTPSNLKGAWDELISEMDAVCSPAAGSGVPGAPMLAMRSKAGRAEQHIPVVFLDLRDVDDRTADESPDILFDSVSESDSEGPAVGRAIGEQWLLDKEEGTTFIQLPLVQRSEGGSSGASGGSGLRSSAVASWDSTLHDSVHLNMITLPGERVYLTAKAYVRLGLHPESSVVVFRKRICVSIFRKSSLSYKLRKSIGSPRGSPLASSSTSAGSWGRDGCSATFEVISSIPKALNQLERGEILARLAASSSEGGEADSCVELSVPPGRGSDRSPEGVVGDGIGTSGQSYIEQYLRSIAAIESMILADKAGQEAAVKESLCKAGRSLRRFGSTPSVGTVDRSSRYLFSPRGEAVTPPLLQSRLAMSVRDLSKSRSPAWSDSSSTASAMTGGRFLRQTFVEADSLAALPTYPEATDEDISSRTETPNSTSTPRFRASRAATGSSRLSASRSSATAMSIKPGANRLSFLSCVGIPAAGEGSGDEDDAYMPSAALSSAKNSPQLLLSSDHQRIGVNVAAGEHTSFISQQLAERSPNLSPGSPSEAATPGIGQSVPANKRSGASENDTATSTSRPVNHFTQQPVDAAAKSATKGSCRAVLGDLHSVHETGSAPAADSSSSCEQACPSDVLLSGALKSSNLTVDAKGNTAGSSDFATGSLKSQTQPITTTRPASATTADDGSHREKADGDVATTSIRVLPALTEWHEDCLLAPEQRDRNDTQPFEATQQKLQQQQLQQTIAAETAMATSAGDPRSRLELISDPYSLTALDCLEAAEESGGSNDGFNSDDEAAAGVRWAAVVSRGPSAGQQHGATVVTVRGGRLRSPVAGDSDSGDSDGNSECSFGSLADLITPGDDAVPSWLQRGASAVVLSTRGKPPRIGTVRSIGDTVIAPGTWVGVQFDDPVGKNDGSVRGVRYFRCPPRHGIFVRPDRVLPNRKDKLREADKGKVTVSGMGQHVAETAVGTSGRLSEPNDKTYPADCCSVSEKNDPVLATERLLSAQQAANADEPELWLPLAASGAAAPHRGASDTACDTAERLHSGAATTSTGQESSLAACTGPSRPLDTTMATLPVPATSSARVCSRDDAGAAFLPDAVAGAPTSPLAPAPAPAAAPAVLTASGPIITSRAADSQSAAMLSNSSAADIASETNPTPSDASTLGPVLSLALRADASYTSELVRRSVVDTSTAGNTSSVARADASSTAAFAKAATPAVISAVPSVGRSIAAAAAAAAAATSSSSAAAAVAAAAAAGSLSSSSSSVAAASAITAPCTSVSYATCGVEALLQRSLTATAADHGRSATPTGTATVTRPAAAEPTIVSDAALSGAANVARMTAVASSKTGNITNVTSADDSAVLSRSAIGVSVATSSGRPVATLSAAAAAAALPSPGERTLVTGASNAEQCMPQSTAGLPAAAHGSESPPAASVAAETPSPVWRPGARASTLRIQPAHTSSSVVAAYDRSPVKLLRGAADASGRQKSAGSTSQTLARLESSERSGRTSPAPSGDGPEPEEVRPQQRKGSFKKLKVPSFMKPTSSSSSKKK